MPMAPRQMAGPLPRAPRVLDCASHQTPDEGFSTLRFGVFAVDLAGSELRRNGRKVRLQEQPFQILCALLERPGDLVTREELRARLWPRDVHVDFERGLNKAVLKLRGALGDSAENPRFIETVPRRGYRFIAPTLPRGEATATSVGVERAPVHAGPWPWLRVAVAGAGVLLAAGLLWRLLPRSTRSVPLVRFTVRLPPDLGFAIYNSASIAFSHDGTRVAYAARGRDGGGLYVRALEGLDVTRLPGTERARSPFFSPDDAWIGFEAGQKLKRAAVTGGSPQILLDLPFPAGATAFGTEGSIALVPSFTGGLFQLAKDGGRPVRLTTPDVAHGEGAHIWPAPLPGGRGVLFTVWSGARSFDQAKVAVLSPGTTEPRVVLEGGYGARYAPSGHLVFVRGGALHAAPFDLPRLALTGPPVPVVSRRAGRRLLGRGPLRPVGSRLARLRPRHRLAPGPPPGPGGPQGRGPARERGLRTLRITADVSRWQAHRPLDRGIAGGGLGPGPRP